MQKPSIFFFEFLNKYISFKSISTNDDHLDDINNCVNWLNDELVKYDFDVDIISGYTNPIILAKLDIGAKETCLLYGHYDVQPADDKMGDWFGDPFQILEKDNKLYARGIVDNKGQFAIHLANIIELAKSKKLKYNIKILIEGNEESGSTEIPRFIRDYKDDLASDFAMISDGELIDNFPTIEASLRGIAVFTARLKTSSKELHSGTYGGFVHNASFELSKIISKLYKGTLVNIPGFYDGAEEFFKKNFKNTEDFNISNPKLKNLIGSENFRSDLNFRAQVGLQPALEIIGLKSGFIRKGYKTSIPNVAEVKLNIRTSGNQKTSDIVNRTIDFFKANTPEWMELEFIDTENKDHTDPVIIDLKNEYLQKAKLILESVYKNKTLLNYVGGSIPLVGELQQQLDIPIIMIPLCNYDCEMHGVNENFDLEILNKSYEFSNEFFET